jgi:hypothetical protein
MPMQHSVHTVICGIFNQETIINHLNQVSIDRPGGGILYAAAGHSLFNKNIGLVAKTNPMFIEKFDKELEKLGIDRKGITTTTRPINDVRFYRILGGDRWETTNLKRHFYEVGCVIPKSLLGIENQMNTSSFKQTEDISLTSSDFPAEYSGARSILLTPQSFQAHFSCIPFLRTMGAQKIFMRSSPSYMVPGKLINIPKLLNGIDFFFTTEQEIRTLFKARLDRYQTMLEILRTYGATYIFIKAKENGFLLMNAEDQQICQIPDYPVFTVDPIGEYDCFCGAFTACLLTENRSLEDCAANASAVASICREGSGVAHILKTYPAIYRLRAELIAHDITHSTISSISD